MSMAPKRKDLARYLVGEVKGHFLAFVVGTSAARLVSLFFETRKVSNLWGLTAKKTLVDHRTMNVLQWICALVVGFIVFEIVNALTAERLHVLKDRIFGLTTENRLKTAATQSSARDR